MKAIVKACPFCGCEGVQILYTASFEIWEMHCPQCDCTGPEAKTEKNAIEKWNERNVNNATS
jgi:Lar family restriction alleviation protein